jgi:hypothetical protein
MRRHALTDARWRRVQRALPKQKAGLRRQALHRSRPVPRKSRPAGGRAVGAIWEPGGRSIAGPRTGRRRTTGPQSCVRRSSMLMRPAPSSMAQWCALTRMRGVEKGVQCFEPLGRRFFDKPPCRRRYQRSSAPYHAHPGQRPEMSVADELREHAHGKTLIADTGYTPTGLVRPSEPQDEARHRLEAGEASHAPHGPQALREAPYRRDLL